MGKKLHRWKSALSLLSILLLFEAIEVQYLTKGRSIWQSE